MSLLQEQSALSLCNIIFKANENTLEFIFIMWSLKKEEQASNTLLVTIWDQVDAI
jgi:hypothetical protein